MIDGGSVGDDLEIKEGEVSHDDDLQDVPATEPGGLGHGAGNGPQLRTKHFGT